MVDDRPGWPSGRLSQFAISQKFSAGLSHWPDGLIGKFILTRPESRFDRSAVNIKQVPYSIQVSCRASGHYSSHPYFRPLH